MFLTPVVYRPAEGSLLAGVVALNPISPILTAARDLLLFGSMSNPAGFWAASALSLLLLVACWWAFHVAIARVVERV